jgi:hypothetical protein
VVTVREGVITREIFIVVCAHCQALVRGEDLAQHILWHKQQEQ